MRKNLFGIRDFLKSQGTRPKLIAFTFDDGPSPYTGALLDGLKTRGAAATFFMTGRNGDGGTCGIQNGHEALLSRMWERRATSWQTTPAATPPWRSCRKSG